MQSKTNKKGEPIYVSTNASVCFRHFRGDIAIDGAERL
jgi:hypothetical protein